MANFGDSRLPQRFWDKCVPVPFAGCWLWFGAGNRYGATVVDGQRYAAHRIAYMRLVGEIPPGLELDHRVCSTPRCCNPAHLEAVTHQVNVSRGKLGEANRLRGMAVTHCRQGHEYTAENTIRCFNGKRACKTCRYASCAAISRRKRESRGLSRRKKRMTAADAEAIRIRFRNGERAAAISVDFGVSDQTVYDINAGRSWARKAG